MIFSLSPNLVQKGGRGEKEKVKWHRLLLIGKVCSFTSKLFSRDGRKVFRQIEVKSGSK